MRKVTVLGSTGSIGVSTLKVIESNPEEYKVFGLAAGRNIDLFTEQIERFRPAVVAISDEELANTLRDRLKMNPCPEVYFGPEGLIDLASLDEADIVLSAITGAAGLAPTHGAIQAGKDVALANKETLVMAGPIIMDLSKKKGVSILPVDSEHSAIQQSMQGHAREDLKRIILTASGGPFKDLPIEEMEFLTPAAALKHPNWDMGRKITIDSSTLMNKGLEIIEAKWLFDLRTDQIGVVIHPESIIHSMVEYMDGSIIAQLGVPDMATPISYALSYPRHLKTDLPPLEIETIGTLNFSKPDMKKFRCLALALDAIEVDGSMPAVLNGANEIAVEAFLNEEIGFLQIPVLIERVMQAHDPVPVEDIEAVMEADRWARETAKKELIPMRS
ncbi:MAG: 1-deoxy-D-xylulose-5-phosphate reductoisomerase [Deltaproteobacteria bacterium]|nr:1-deoxy-D-xylulose-5-phosphate reductoisomerase [Deltaproteobacteria bacterium]MBW1914281.1 1-deoxy-D-xylulose-5-phosphate reductoisomerase [Deltaproteobacteria bacterium]